MTLIISCNYTSPSSPTLAFYEVQIPFPQITEILGLIRYVLLVNITTFFILYSYSAVCSIYSTYLYNLNDVTKHRSQKFNCNH